MRTGSRQAPIRVGFRDRSPRAQVPTRSILPMHTLPQEPVEAAGSASCVRLVHLDLVDQCLHTALDWERSLANLVASEELVVLLMSRWPECIGAVVGGLCAHDDSRERLLEFRLGTSILRH